MSSEFCLGDIAEIIMGQSPAGENCNSDGNGLPLLNGPTEFGSKHPYPVQFTTDYKKLANSGDLLFCVRGSTTGKMNWAEQTYVIGRGIAAIRGKNGYPNSFIRAAIESNLESLLVQATGSTFPNVSRDLISSLVIPEVTPKEAIAIASVIEPLDDRIALLRETNTTLEAISQALFKSWFVDFDPVLAKAQGVAPEGMDEATAALFPDSFEESGQGLVPMGWKVGTIADIASVKGGFAYKGESFCQVGSPVIKIKNIVGDGTVDLVDAQFIAADLAIKTKRFALEDGDIVIAMTGATIGKTGVVVTEGNKIPYLNQRVAKFEPNISGQDNRWLVFVAFQNDFISDQVVNTASGSAQPNISTSGIESVRLVTPSDHKILDLFGNTLSPLFQSWMANQRQAKTLATLRDTLLPRLISGQLRLPDAQPQIEEALT